VAQLADRSAAWTEQEFGNLDLGGTRLNERARMLMERLAAEPTVPGLTLKEWIQTERRELLLVEQFVGCAGESMHVLLEPAAGL
jgi:hypothetical protein